MTQFFLVVTRALTFYKLKKKKCYTYLKNLTYYLNNARTEKAGKMTINIHSSSTVLVQLLQN